MRLLASSLIQCHFVYACAAWYRDLLKHCQQKLQILQNKTIRFILDRPSRSSHVGIAEFEVLNWIPVSELAKKIIFVKYIVYLHGSAPNLERNCPWLVSGIQSLPGIVCSPLSCHCMWNYLGPNLFLSRQKGKWHLHLWLAWDNLYNLEFKPAWPTFDWVGGLSST